MLRISYAKASKLINKC